MTPTERLERLREAMHDAIRDLQRFDECDVGDECESTTACRRVSADLKHALDLDRIDENLARNSK